MSWNEKGGTKKAIYAEDNKWVWLRRSRGRLVKTSRDGTIEVIAGGRDDWMGWLELKREEVDEQATRNTAAVIADMDPDILGVIEAEDREFHISYAMSMSGTFHYKYGNWVWVTAPTCRKWGPNRPAVVHCHMNVKWGPTPGHLDVIGDFRFPVEAADEKSDDHLLHFGWCTAGKTFLHSG